MVIDQAKLNQAREAVGEARRVVVFTGAGVSAESGIPTFRGEGGLWEKYNPAIYGNLPGLAAAFMATPAKVTGFAGEALRTFLAAEPNPAHQAIAALEKMGKAAAVVTQNIDDLHERAGSTRVIKLHGDLLSMRCVSCGVKRKLAREDLEGIASTLEAEAPGRIELIKYLRQVLPRCSRCDGLTRPNVVFFGEALPVDALTQAQDETRGCELLLIVGTSGVVYPAAALPYEAKTAGARIIECNGEPSPYTELADLSFFGRAGEILPQIIPQENYS